MVSLRQIVSHLGYRKQENASKALIKDRRMTPERRRHGTLPEGRMVRQEIVPQPAAYPSAQEVLEKTADELSKLLDSAVDAVITIDAEHCIVRFNLAASRMFGVPAAEALGTNVERFIPERSRMAHRQGVRKFAEGLLPHHTMGMAGNVRGLRANGEEFPFEATIARVSVGGSVRMTVFMRDITDRVSAEEALRRGKEDLELAVRGSHIGIWSWDFASDEVVWSERTYELFSIPQGEAMNFQRFMAAVHPEDREYVQTSIHQTMNWQAEYRIECRTVWPDGSIHWIQGLGRYLLDNTTHQAVGMRGIVLDITERKEQEARLMHLNTLLEAQVHNRTHELSQAIEALEQSNLELQQFAFIAAHDLQTPLRSISGFSQLLQQKYLGRLGGEAEEWLAQLIRSSARMRDLIQDVLAYSLIDSQGETYRRTELNPLFDNVVATFEAAIRESKARVIREDLPVVTVDRLQIGQVLQNLIDNALKYRRDAEPRIHVSARRESGQWVIAVEDNGIGISPKHLRGIFDIFRRLHTQEDYPGTGIGLAICRRIIHRHGGKIWVESEPGRGSIFYFTLPDRPEKESQEIRQAPL